MPFQLIVFKNVSIDHFCYITRQMLGLQLAWRAINFNHVLMFHGSQSKVLLYSYLVVAATKWVHSLWRKESSFITGIPLNAAHPVRSLKMWLGISFFILLRTLF